MSHCPRHLVLLALKIFPIPIIFVPQPVSQSAFIEDLEHSYVKNHITRIYRPILSPALYSFFPCRLGFPSHLGQVRLVSGFFRPGKQSASNFIDGGMGGQPNGEFFLVFRVYIFFGFFFSHSHHIHCKKPCIVNKIIHHLRVLSRSFS